MTSGIAINTLTVEQKIELMEALWKDLSDHADSLPIPQWHRDVLADRERRIQEGTATFSDWEAARIRIKRAACESRNP
jgi:hypothetical protein